MKRTRPPTVLDLLGYRLGRGEARIKRLYARFDAALDAQQASRFVGRMQVLLGGRKSRAFLDEYLKHLLKLNHAATPTWLLSIMRVDILNADSVARAEATALACAERLSSEGQLEPATTLLQGLLDRAIIDVETERLLGSVLAPHVRKLIASDQVETAGRLARRFHSKNPQRPLSVLLLEEALTAGGRASEATELIQAAMAADPNEPRYVFRRGTRLYDSLEVEAADRLLSEFIDNHPDEDTVLRLLVRKLSWRRRFQDAAKLVENALDRRATHELLGYLIDVYLAMGDVTGGRTALAQYCTEHGMDPRDGWAEARLLAAEGKLEEATAHLEELRDRAPRDRQIQRATSAQLSHLGVRHETADILRTVPLNRDIHGVTALVTHGSDLSHVWMGLVALEMRKRGFATVILEQAGMCPIPPTGDPDIDQLHGIIDLSGYRLREEPREQTLRYDWTIDPAGGVVGTEGFNFFPSIAARIGTAMRRYDFDFDHPLAREFMEDQIRKADTLLAVCHRVADTLGARRIPVRFLGGMSQYLPGAVTRQFCDRYRGDLDMEHIEFEAAYQHYYDNLSEITSTAISVENVTKHPRPGYPGKARPDHFDRWISQLTPHKRAQHLREVDDILALDRARVRADPLAAAVYGRVAEHKGAGKPVVCLLGKVLYDIWLEDLSGSVHRDMIDWVTHSVDSVRGTQTLLLVKPHPDEIKPQVALPTQFFQDLLPDDIPDNVLLLQHRWFNLKQLRPFIDCATIWSGTATLELQAQGVPVVVCSSVGSKDYPVDLREPADRDDYTRTLRNPRILEVAPETRERSALLIKYLSTPEVMTPYPYANVPYLRGSNAGLIHWKTDLVKRYLAEGDPHITAIAERCY